MKRWLLTHRYEVFLLAVALCIGIFLRFYRLEAYIHFLGDEGRDMRVVRAMYTKGDIPFLGPNASVGGFFLGPIYYWMIAPALFLAGSNPVGPAVLVAVLGSMMLLCVSLAGRWLSGPVAGVTAGFLYAVAPIVVRYSRFSWNPNPVPFFSILAVGSVVMAVTRKRVWWYLVSGAALGVNLQLHYLTTILFPILFVVVLLTEHVSRWWKAWGLIVGGFLLTYAPFLLFEMKNTFPNHRTILEFVTRENGAVHLGIGWIMESIHSVGNGLYRILFPTPFDWLPSAMFWGSAAMLFSIVVIVYRRRTTQRVMFVALAVWFFGGIVGLAAYQGAIYDYYYGFLYPVPFLVFGVAVAETWNAIQRKWWRRLFLRAGLVGIVLFLAIVIGEALYIWNPPQYMPRQTQDIARFVLEETASKPYNFALIAQMNSDDAYRYYLELAGRPPIDIENPMNDPERTTVMEQLLVVCEDVECKPLGHPKWEIAGFGQAEIVGEWYMVGGIRVQKLVHYSD